MRFEDLEVNECTAHSSESAGRTDECLYQTPALALTLTVRTPSLTTLLGV